MKTDGRHGDGRHGVECRPKIFGCQWNLFFANQGLEREGGARSRPLPELGSVVDVNMETGRNFQNGSSRINGIRSGRSMAFKNSTDIKGIIGIRFQAGNGDCRTVNRFVPSPAADIFVFIPDFIGIRNRDPVPSQCNRCFRRADNVEAGGNVQLWCGRIYGIRPG